MGGGGVGAGPRGSRNREASVVLRNPINALEVGLGREGVLHRILEGGAQGLFNCGEVGLVFVKLENILHKVIVSAGDRWGRDHEGERRVGGAVPGIILERRGGEVKRRDVHVFIVAVKHAVFVGRVAIAESQTVE